MLKKDDKDKFYGDFLLKSNGNGHFLRISKRFPSIKDITFTDNKNDATGFSSFPQVMDEIYPIVDKLDINIIWYDKRGNEHEVSFLDFCMFVVKDNLKSLCSSNALEYILSSLDKKIKTLENINKDISDKLEEKLKEEKIDE